MPGLGEAQDMHGNSIIGKMQQSLRPGSREGTLNDKRYHQEATACDARCRFAASENVRTEENARSENVGTVLSVS